MNPPAPLNVSPRLLLGPGPCDAHPNVLRAMVTPLLGHLDPQFLEVMSQNQAMLRAEFDTLLVVDTVTSLGCIPVALDAWGVDAAYSCSQKGLGCPSGLAPVSFSPRAVEAVEKRKTKVQSWYLDLSLLRKYFSEKPVY